MRENESQYTDSQIQSAYYELARHGFAGGEEGITPLIEYNGETCIVGLGMHHAHVTRVSDGSKQSILLPQFLAEFQAGMVKKLG